jgi:uncharacterized protein YjbI with pentapeptide repeats
VKVKILATAAILAPLWLTTPVKAENPDHVKRLLETKQCQGCDLSGVNLTNANLEGVNLSGANLSDAVLVGANLTNANLQAANLTRANLTHAKLTNVYLDKANLIGATGIERQLADSLVLSGQEEIEKCITIGSEKERYVTLTTRANGRAFRVPDLAPPPRGQGIPVKRQGGSTRGDGESLTALIPPDFSGLTFPVVTEYPTFFAYVPPLDVLQTASRTAKFVLEDEKENEVYRTTLILPSQGGIVGIRLPTTRSLVSLDIGKKYVWYFESGDGSGVGLVKRVKLCPTLLREIEKAAFNERPAIYAKAGLWYEALTTLAQLHRANPNDATLTQQWEDLLESVGLEHIAKKPLLESLPQSNESPVQPLGTGKIPNQPAVGASSAEVKPSRGDVSPPDIGNVSRPVDMGQPSARPGGGTH